MSTNDGSSNTVIQPDVCAAAALDYERRIAVLEVEVERLKTEWAQSELEDKAYADGLEAEIKRLNARERSINTEWVLRCQTLGREADRHCATVAKLSRRLGCIRKRRRKELAEFEDILGRHKQSEHALVVPLEKRTAEVERLKTQIRRLDQLIADATCKEVSPARLESSGCGR